ncbi:uncharacterized protein [Maniola hyperantus]
MEQQLNRECSLFTEDGRFVIVGSAAHIPDDYRPHFYQIHSNNEAVTPTMRSALENYSLHLVDLHQGKLCDTKHFRGDKIYLSHNQGIYLYKEVLAVLSVQHQTIHLFQIVEGMLIEIRKIGRFCYDDDPFIVSPFIAPLVKERPYCERTINSLKHRLLVFLFKRAKSISDESNDPLELRKFYKHFDMFKTLRMWKMQLLDEDHLFIKYASEEVVTLRVAEPNSQSSFFAIYNISESKILDVYENTSEELLQLFENYCDCFRNARLCADSQFTCSPSNNLYARLAQQRFKQTIVRAIFGGRTEATKRILAQLPISAQSYSGSPYLDLGLFSYDDKWVSVMERPKAYGEYPIRKTFNNANALQNHKNMQHDSNNSGNGDYQPTMNGFEQTFDVLRDFQFIPLKKSNEDIIKLERDGITKRTYGEGTSYLIVKYKSYETARGKKLRLNNMIKKMQLKPEKKPVDLGGPFTCTLPSNVYLGQCRQIFFNCCEYSLHYREEHTKRRKAALRCQVCEKRLDRNLYPTNALTPQTQSTNVVTFTCHACGLSFFDSTQYDEHRRIVHAKIKPYQCSICFKRFTQAGGLQQHMRMHNGIRPFICKFCAKAFTQKAGLDQHLRTHTKVKPFKCIICCKCFSQSVHLRQHMRTHTNIQPFGCPMCKKRFKQSSHLNFHMRSHVGEMSALLMEQYTQTVHQQTSSMDFLNLSNVQPVQDGDTLYYAAQLTSGPESTTSATTPYFPPGAFVSK